MKIIVNSQQFAAELRLLKEICAEKAALAALNHIKVQADEQGLIMAATNMAVTLITACPATVEEPGTVLLPAKTLADTMEQLPDAAVAIRTDSKLAHLTCGGFKSSFLLYPIEDYPELPQMPEVLVKLPTVVIQRLIECSIYAVSDKIGNFAMTGVLFSLAGTDFGMVATDGNRLTMIRAGRECGVEKQAVLTKQVLESLKPMLNENEVLFSDDDKHNFFQVGPRLLAGQKLEASFPGYSRILEQVNDKTMLVDRAALAAAVRRCGTVTEINTAVYLEWLPNAVHISGQRAGVGNADETVAASYDGPELKICLSSAHLLDFLDRASEATIEMSTRDVMSPLMVRAGLFLNVIMVMR